MLHQQHTSETFNRQYHNQHQGDDVSEQTDGQHHQNGWQQQENKSAFLAKIIAETSSQSNTGRVLDLESKDQADSETHVPQLLLAEVNDVVYIERVLNHQHYLARSDQQVGKLAKSHCRILDEQIPDQLCQYLTENQFYDLHICFASFVAQDVGDLSVTKGDIIVAINPVNEHWLQGQVCFDSQADSWPRLILGKQVGTFPLNHCWQLNAEQVKLFCHKKLKQEQKIKSTISDTSWNALMKLPPPPSSNNVAANHSAAHSSSLSSGSSSIYSSEHNSNANHQSAFNTSTTSNNNQQLYQNQYQNNASNGYLDNNFNSDQQSRMLHHDKVDSISRMVKPPPRPEQLPRQLSNRQKSSSEQAFSRPPSSILSNKQQDKLKGWFHTVKKKTARCAMRISANLGLISLTRDEVFERHYESFKQLEKSIRVFIKNLTLFVEHFESFLLALQTTSDNLADFYRDKSHQAEITELRKKNKALNCEHFHAFKRTVDRQVIAVASQLLQKFSGPHQLIHKRSAKLLDYDTKTKEMESCRDLDKKATLREQYVIAKDLYDRINGQLIEELPLFNQFALDIFKDCILVLLDSRRNLIMSYTKQTESLIRTPLMSSFTASDVASTIMMTCDFAANNQAPSSGPLAALSHKGTATQQPSASMDNTKFPMGAADVNSLQGFKSSRSTSEHGTQPSSSCAYGDGSSSRPHSALSQLSSEFDQMALVNREISSTPLSQLSGSQHQNQTDDDELRSSRNTSTNGDGAHFDEPDTVVRFAEPDEANTDNKQNENIESAIVASKASGIELSSAAPSSNGEIGDEKSSKDKSKKKRTRHPIYIASWPFVATGPNQLTIACNQPLKLLKGCDSIGNPDWSLVKNQANEIGYVPTAYLKKKDP